MPARRRRLGAFLTSRMDPMTVLGIESSCDETAAAVVDGGGRVLSSVIASQIPIHAPYGGVVPEIAARRHLETIDPVIRHALEDAGVSLADLSGIAVTRGPGLIGCLLVGLSVARAVAWSHGLPVVGVNHLEGHIVSGWIECPDLPYPSLALVVSGGHTAIWRVMGPGRYVELMRTRDDAAGEAFDKIGKLLGLAYPGGPEIDRLAEEGNPSAVSFGAVRVKGRPAFSFSGYKTAARNHAQKTGIAPLAAPDEKPAPSLLDLVASFRHAVVRELVRGLERAVEDDRPRSVVLAGGVAANKLLRREVTSLADRHGLALSIPSLEYCGDNAAMIALAGRRRLARGESDLDELDASASLPLGRPEKEEAPRRHR